MSHHSLTPPSDFFLYSSALMCVLNIEGIIVQVNPAWEKKFNVVPTDLEQSDYFQWVHPADKADTVGKLAQLGIGQQDQHDTTNREIPFLTHIAFSNRWRDGAGYYYWLNWEISVVPFNPDSFPEKSSPIFYAVATNITAQKQAEKILRDTEERFELAIQGSNHGLWDWNLETNEIYLSPRWKNMLGYQDNEIANNVDEWCRFVHPDDFMEMWATIEAYLDKKIPCYESIYRVCHKDRSYRWVLARAAALWDENAQPHRMVGIYTDITERKQIECALQESEALLSAIFDVTKIGLCVTDEEGLFARINPVFCQLYGYSAEELLGRHFTTVLLPEDHERMIKLHQALLRGDTTVATEGEWRIQNKAGKYLDISFTMGFLSQHNGRCFLVTTITDITKRKHDEAERNRLFNFSLDMQSIIGFDSTFKEVNAAWERTLGWSKVELLNKSPLVFVHPDESQSSLKTLQQLLQGKTVFGFENRFLCKNGTYKWLSWNVYPLAEQQSMYVVTRDITERKRAEEEIKKQQAFTRLVVDSIPNLIFVKDGLGKFIFVNQSFANLIGMSIDELIHRQPNSKLYYKNEREVIEQQREMATEETYCNAEGERRCFYMLKKPFVQGDGEVLVLSVGVDITERKRQEKALKLSEARYRAIIHDQIDLICRFQPDMTLTFVNEAYCRYFGKTEAELIGHPFMPYRFRESQGSFEKLLAQLTPEKPAMIDEYRTHMPDGTVRWQQWIDRALFDLKGNVIEYQAVGRDITASKRAQEALQQSEERLRLVTSAAPVILFALDAQGVFTFLRGKALNVLNLTDDKLVGKSIFETVSYLPKQFEDIHRALAGETVTTLTTLPHLSLETKLTPLFDSKQNIIGVIGVSIDITERHTLELKLKGAIAELETILDNSVVGIAYLRQGVFIRVNRKLESLLGYTQNELCGLSFSTIFPSQSEYLQMEQEAYPLLEQGKEYDAGHMLRTQSNDTFWSRIVGKAVDADKLDNGSIWMIEDITLQKQAEQHLRLTAMIFETSANAIFVTDAKNKIQRVNPAFSKITGYSLQEVYGKKTSCLSSGQHNQQFYEDMWKDIKDTGHWQGEIWNRRKNGEIYVAWLSISVITNENNIPIQYMAILTDISSLQEEIENVRYLANYDSLTRLPNRMLFHDNLLQAQDRAKQNNRLFALLFIDLDGFKPVNDNLGHAIGDQLLQGVARRLQKCVRETDTVARLGGDEFTIILNDIKKNQDAAKVATDIVQRLQQPFQLGKHQVTISASIGISVYPYDSQEIDSLIKHADMAMYEAKHAGKGRYCFYAAAHCH